MKKLTVFHQQHSHPLAVSPVTAVPLGLQTLTQPLCPVLDDISVCNSSDPNNPFWKPQNQLSSQNNTLQH